MTLKPLCSVLCCALMIAMGAPVYAAVTADQTALLAATWPTHSQHGNPVLTTITNPLTLDGFTAVPESFPNSRALGMTFTVTSDFTLGAVSMRFSGGPPPEDPNNPPVALPLTLHLYDIDDPHSLPGSYRPTGDGTNTVNDSTAGDMFTGASFYWFGAPEDRMLLLSLDGDEVVNLLAGHLYALEVRPSYPDDFGGTSNSYWTRTAGGGPYAGGDGFEANAYAGSGVNDPANTIPYMADTNLRTRLAGAARDFAMALYEFQAVTADADFDDDSDVDADDVDILADMIFRGGADPGGNDTADLDGAGGVTQDDMDYMINTELATVYGDADLDDDVDGADFDAWRIRDSLGGGIGWATGDWDGDNDVDGADFDHWRLRLPAIGGGGVAAVPEPATFVLMGLAIPALGLMARRRK